MGPSSKSDSEASLMDPKTLTALKASIKHWEENWAAETPDDASVEGKDCALCDAFFEPEAFGGPCPNCPVRHETDAHWCEGSPWVAARDHYVDWYENPDDMSLREAWRNAARIETNFLKSLLPEDDKDTSINQAAE